MGDKVLTVKLPDGSTESRKTPRDYTHAIIVTRTQVARDRALARITESLEFNKAKIVALSPQAQTADDRAAYAAAKSHEAYLEEIVTETLTNYDGKPYQHSCMRWLSDEFNAGKGKFSDHGIKTIRAAVEAVMKTAQGEIDHLKKQVEIEEAALVRCSDRHQVGASFVFGWSQSAKGSAAQASKAQDENPSDKVTISTEIDVRVVQKREKKTA